jgi:uncharacterized membrane protein
MPIFVPSSADHSFDFTMPFAEDNLRDEAEWQNPDNWHGGPLNVYFSRRDSRAFVPKRNPAFGVTINFAHAPGIIFLLCIAGFVVLIEVLTRHS